AGVREQRQRPGDDSGHDLAGHERDEQPEPKDQPPPVSVRAHGAEMTRAVVLIVMSAHAPRPTPTSPVQQESVQPGPHSQASWPGSGTAAHSHPSPRQASIPSLTATAATPSPTSGSSHHQPNSALVASPARTAAASAAQIRFWVPSPAVAFEPSRAPSRCLATPSSGMSTRLLAVSAMPRTVVPGSCLTTRSRTDSAAT